MGVRDANSTDALPTRPPDRTWVDPTLWSASVSPIRGRIGFRLLSVPSAKSDSMNQRSWIPRLESVGPTVDRMGRILCSGQARGYTNSSRIGCASPQNLAYCSADAGRSDSSRIRTDPSIGCESCRLIPRPVMLTREGVALLTESRSVSSTPLVILPESLLFVRHAEEKEWRRPFECDLELGLLVIELGAARDRSAVHAYGADLFVVLRLEPLHQVPQKP